MAKSLVFGNGRMHVGLDEFGLVHDLYYPYVGQENHLPSHGLPHKVGLYADGRLSWLDDGTWSFATRYHDGVMVGNTIATNDSLGLRVELTDAVDQSSTLFVRTLHVINTRDTARDVQLYCHQAFMISDSASSDTAQYRPDLPAIMHYKGNRVFLVHLSSEEADFDEYSVGTYDSSSGTGTFMDADDGVLAKNTVENGRTDSVMGLKLLLGAYDSALASYALIASETIPGVEQLFGEYLENGAMHYLARTAVHWRKWTASARLSPELDSAYRKAVDESLVVIAAHIDARGAIMASLDSSLRNHPQDDAYNFCWARDAVYTLWPLLRLGYSDELINFFDFAVRGLHEDGYLLHKYRADGSLRSTWLPYLHPDNTVSPPIQADETASVLFLLGQQYRQATDQAFVARYYESLVEPMANFLAGYTDAEGLPLPSYDIWEHSYLTHTYTTAVTYGALLEASELADVFGRSADGVRWRAAAETMQSASSCFYDETRRYFYKGFIRNENGEKVFDDTFDSSSLYGAFMFGLFDLKSDELEASLATLRERFGGGPLYPRFEGDTYFGDATKPNVWPISSLWMAEMALERDDSDEAKAILDAVLALRSSAGMLPEQVHPDTHAATSLSPLVWSHAELISAMIDYTQTRNGE